ncbi:NEDD4-binding protein 2-like 1 [Clytia hemisphaerica]|uniref:NEDD4-binding protein 2-like 1 n=1 Tax=Clytia hemisphaerica TaxID=252671 RepID=UPI0034D6F133|eukprot:TCONS_00051230-protein
METEDASDDFMGGYYQPPPLSMSMATSSYSNVGHGQGTSSSGGASNMSSLPSTSSSSSRSAPMESIEDILSSSKLLFILRGLPGSGKTTRAMELTNDATLGVILATDDFFTKDGVYTYNKKMIGKAHQWNQERTKLSMEACITPICIDNTNTQKFEMKPYVLMADKYGYQVSIVEPTTDWKFTVETCLQKSSKNQTLKVDDLKRMKKRYQRNVKLDDIRNCENPYQKKKKSSPVSED